MKILNWASSLRKGSISLSSSRMRGSILGIVTLASGLISCVTVDTQQRDDNKKSWRAERPKAKEPAATQIPKFQVASLENGLTVYVVKNNDLPIVQVSLVTKAGAGLDPKYKSGTASLAYDMLLEGAGPYDSLGYSSALAKLGTGISISELTTTNGSMTLGVTRKNLGTAISLMSTAVKTPHFYTKDFVRLRKRALQALQAAQADPNYQARNAFYENAFEPSTAYARPVGGTPKSVAQITLRDVKEYYKTYIHSKNSALIFTGDITLPKAIKLAKRHFSNWNGHLETDSLQETDPPVEFAPQKRTGTKITLISREHSPQSMILIGQPIDTQKRKNGVEAAVMNEILGGMFSSRLNMKLREEKGWTYGARSGLSFKPHGIIFSAGASVQVPYGAEALAESFKIFTDMRESKVTKAELKAAKDGMIRSFAGNFESVSSLSNMASTLFVLDRPANYYQDWTKYVDKVDRGDVRNAARKFLDPSKQTVVAVGDLTALEKPIKTLGLGNVTVR